jgi:hypothetical protein
VALHNTAILKFFLLRPLGNKWPAIPSLERPLHLRAVGGRNETP